VAATLDDPALVEHDDLAGLPDRRKAVGIHHLPLQRQVHGETISYYEYRLTEAQVQSLIDAVQKIKYPHNLKNTTKLSMEEFERLEALRQLLIDGLR